MPFYPEDATQSPCQANTRSLQQNSQPVHDSGLNQIPPATVNKFTNPSDLPPPIHAPTPHVPFIPYFTDSFPSSISTTSNSSWSVSQPANPYLQHPLPYPPSPDEVNNNINHDQQSSSNYNNVINNLLHDYPELHLEDLNLEPNIPYPNHQEYNIDQYQKQYYESEDHQDAPTDQFDYQQDESGNYDNGGDDFNYDDGGGDLNYDDGGEKYENEGYYDDYN